MHRSLDALLFRGLLGTALSIAAVTAAATQAPRYQVEMDLDDGRLVLIETPDLAAQCSAPRDADLLALTEG
jgi:hypothetical protein